MAKVKADWWTSPTESESGRLILVTGRKDMDSYIKSGKFNYRIDVTWNYEADLSGLPDTNTSRLLGEATDRLLETFDNDSVAIITGIYTGDGQRNYVFYCRKLQLFEKLFNQALADMPTLPIEISVEDDPTWAEYREMKELSEIFGDD